MRKIIAISKTFWVAETPTSTIQEEKKTELRQSMYANIHHQDHQDSIHKLEIIVSPPSLWSFQSLIVQGCRITRRLSHRFSLFCDLILFQSSVSVWVIGIYMATLMHNTSNSPNCHCQVNSVRIQVIKQAQAQTS